MRLEPIIPKGKFIDAGELARDIERDMDNAAYDAMSLYEDTTRTWSNRPNFYIRKVKNARIVGTKSKIFAYVDKGTKAHTIKSKRAGGVLRFKRGGKAKTRPGSLQSNRGIPGKQWVSSKIVRHPGTEARDFSVNIEKRMQKQLVADVRKSIRKAVRKR